MLVVDILATRAQRQNGIYKSEVGGMSSPLGGPAVTGKSFLFVRARPAWALAANKNPTENLMRAVRPFSSFAQEALPSPFGRAVPFSFEDLANLVK